ncbi:TRAP transporter small permease [Roseomonas populi]|uniref:TRAP transporter small permease protein n=1 Tax=Roseomonas populi TaxID=3121582 RepID=A0ABT1XCX5_9PROT|nr:TRAP transporter small permease [Roseomonas pecuniae]MCR0985591.1 TRAP transporter small permease [Roseomonas pecuniae]
MTSTLRYADTWLARLEAFALALLVLAMTGTTLAQVVARYAFNEPLIWSEEAARYLFVWVSLLGAALATREGTHYVLDALVQRFPHAGRLAARGVAVIVSAGFLVILVQTGINETSQASLQDSATLPIGMALPYAAIPVGAALMLFHLLAGLLIKEPQPEAPLPEAVG